MSDEWLRPSHSRLSSAQVGGPSTKPNTNGQVENIDDGEVVGAVNALAPHPTNADIFFVASVNGGVWRTANATAPRPSWVPAERQGTLEPAGSRRDRAHTAAGLGGRS
jgi:hypothetical protein